MWRAPRSYTLAGLALMALLGAPLAHAQGANPPPDSSMFDVHFEDLAKCEGKDPTCILTAVLQGIVRLISAGIAGISTLIVGGLRAIFTMLIYPLFDTFRSFAVGLSLSLGVLGAAIFGDVGLVFRTSYESMATWLGWMGPFGPPVALAVVIAMLAMVAWALLFFFSKVNAPAPNAIERAIEDDDEEKKNRR